MADQRILYTEKMVGANHPNLPDTLNRLSLIEHNTDGTHKFTTDTTQSSSTSTGAIITAGGLGVAKNAHIGGDLTVTGHATLEGVTPTGATGSGKLVFDTIPTIASPTISGHATIEGVSVAGATGTGNIVFSTSPTLTSPSIGVATGTSFNSITGLSATTPSMDGSASVGTATTTARADHVHPSNTAKADKSGNLSQFASTTSAQLAGVISDETGSGALVFANTPTLVAPVLGTPNSGTLTNCTGLPISTGVSGLGANVGAFLGTPTSANLAAAITGETGTGALVFANSPNLVTPNIGVASGTSFNSITALSSTLPSMDSVAAIGTSTTVARADHTHPSDTTKAAAADLSSHVGNTSNPHSVTQTQVGLGNVENKSSATIRSEITSSNVTTALGFTPENVSNKSTSVSADGSSDTKYPSVKAVKDYADGLVVGLLDYRGAYNASGNVFPSTGGSGAGGAVLKGDMWIISVAGTLGGVAIQIGDSVIAATDSPGQTAGNWNTLNGNVSYVPANAATTISTSAPLSGGGDLSTNRTLSISQATTSTDGYLSSTDWNTFNGKASTSGTLGQFATTTSSQLAGVISDETGSGSLVFNTSPTLSGVTLSDGTANGVLYLNGSKQVTSGSALTFDGSKLTVATSDLTTAFFTNATTSGATTGAGIGFNVYNGSSVAQNGSIVSTASTWSYGTYSANQLSISANGSGGVRVASANAPIVFHTGDSSNAGLSAERMRLDASGNLGIGTSSITQKLTVAGSIASNAGFFTSYNGSTPTGYIGYGTSLGTANDIAIRCDTGNILLGFSGATAATLNSSGNLGLGTSSPAAKLHVAGTGSQQALVQSTNGGTTSLQLLNTGVSSRVFKNVSGALVFEKDAVAQATLDSSGNLGIGVTPSAWYSAYRAIQMPGGSIESHAGYIGMWGNCYLNSSAQYTYVSDESASRYLQNSGYHIWQTAPSGTAGSTITFTEQMRLDSSGNLLVGTTSLITDANCFNYSPGNTWGIFGHGTGVASGTEYVKFRYGSSQIGSIAQSGTTAVAYNTNSDYRLKHDVQPLTGALEKVAALKPCTYRWKADGSAGEGFIAHELAEVCPQAVTGEKDAVDAEGKPVYQGIDQSKIVPLLTAALQEAVAKIESLTQRIEALEYTKQGE